MHIRTIAEKKVIIDNNEKRKEVLRLFKKAYEGVLQSVEAISVTKAEDHNMKQGEEIKKESASVLVQKAKDFISFFLGIDLNDKAVILPSKVESFTPAAQI